MEFEGLTKEQNVAIKALSDVCFAVESVAHLQGREDLLAFAVNGREAISWILDQWLIPKSSMKKASLDDLPASALAALMRLEAKAFLREGRSNIFSDLTIARARAIRSLSFEALVKKLEEEREVKKRCKKKGE